MGPSEDPEDKKNRLRERRQSLLERRDASETGAGGLTSDLRGIYGLEGISMFGKRGSGSAKPASSASATSPNR